RARKRGPLWDAVPALCFKAFLLREKGSLGSIAGSYSSLYLWQHDTAFADFLVSGRYKTVTDSFGRADIETVVALDARRGRGHEARFATTHTLDVPLDADLTATLANAIARNRENADNAGTVAAAIGLDTRRWTLVRITLSDHEPAATEPGTHHEILHLARPLLDTLPAAGAR
ncbi:MAG TPA: DUF4865 family protein, partial [Vineibacter sp.]|nr:DUF4865 family protein [Vineibacter sp.]